MSFFHHVISHFIINWGYLTVFVMLAIEGFGLFFMPGETTLIAAAVYCGATGNLNIFIVIGVGFLGAITGDNFAFWVGHRFGFKLLRHYGHIIRLNERRIKFIQYLYLRYGAPIVFVGRFVILLRSWESFLAGANGMLWRRFLLTNLAASLVWVCVWGFGAYGLGAVASGDLVWISIGIFVFIILLFIAGGIYFRRHEEELEAKADKTLPGPLRAHTAADLKQAPAR